VCGIVGVAGSHEVLLEVVTGLKKLEYRGYDSAGVAVVDGKGKIQTCRSVGKIYNLEKKIKEYNLQGHSGIGHTRWATHGKPEERNAHPIVTEQLALVHNGIIENHEELRSELQAKGYKFTSDTDTEVIAILISDFVKHGLTQEKSIQEAVAKLEGSYAFALVFNNDTNKTVYGYKNGAPLALGHMDGANYIGSDSLALSPFTNEITYLEDNDLAIINPRSFKIVDCTTHVEIKRPVKTVEVTEDSSLEGYPHYMLKEIFEQPQVIKKLFEHYVSDGKITREIPSFLSETNSIHIIACGTSYHSALIAKYWLEEINEISVNVDIASEFRYRKTPLDKNSVCIFVSQSGETADTFAALKHARSKGAKIVSIINVTESSIANASDFILPNFAGPEIGVASTKAFTAQLFVFAMLTLQIQQQRMQSDVEISKHINNLAKLSQRLENLLAKAGEMEALAKKLQNYQKFIYIGRGSMLPVALEGCLKLKELSYIPAEGLASGELKHGPIALVDETTAIIALAPDDALFEKNASNIQEVAARDGKILILTSSERSKQLEPYSSWTYSLPEAQMFCSEIEYTLPLQLLAYYITLYNGLNVDQPRNLAKSVTVE
jgi:glucosamine--fructose-6-phosphate aminotransferase (isomerizing)